jgi:hypothetical protein
VFHPTQALGIFTGQEDVKRSFTVIEVMLSNLSNLSSKLIPHIEYQKYRKQQREIARYGHD